MPIEIREASTADQQALVALRWQWHVERHGDEDGDLGDFERGFARWWSGQDGRFRAVVARDESGPIGMGFLAVVNRVPGPGELDRHHGDIQSMYVTPAHRGSGVGSEILRVFMGLAREAGCGRVEVHSGRRAVAFYERAGFEHFRQLMNNALDD